MPRRNKIKYSSVVVAIASLAAFSFSSATGAEDNSTGGSDVGDSTINTSKDGVGVESGSVVFSTLISSDKSKRSFTGLRCGSATLLKQWDQPFDVKGTFKSGATLTVTIPYSGLSLPAEPAPDCLRFKNVTIRLEPADPSGKSVVKIEANGSVKAAKLEMRVAEIKATVEGVPATCFSKETTYLTLTTGKGNPPGLVGRPYNRNNGTVVLVTKSPVFTPYLIEGTPKKQCKTINTWFGKRLKDVIGLSWELKSDVIMK